MAWFLVVVLGIWGLMHLYVFWRVSSIPWVAGRIPGWALVVAAVALWASYVVARMLDSRARQALWWPLEYAAANWIGILFLLLAALLIVDVVTLGGRLWSGHAGAIRGWAVLAAGVLALLALVQAHRPPLVREYEVELAGLPPERDGTTLVQISDLHLGNLLGRQWLLKLVQRVKAMNPDLVVVVGDLVDGNVERVEPLREVLQSLQAPLGVWAVTGNHEVYAGLERSVTLMREAGFQVLRGRNAEAAPGLVIAGVDDLTARGQFGRADDAIEKALANRSPGATILLSHSPVMADRAAAAGAGLMLSGHTHNGQVWPFTYLVALKYPLVAGRYDVNGMPVIVCRGTGTWGPRMRLWQPSEVVRVKLRARLPQGPATH